MVEQARKEAEGCYERGELDEAVTKYLHLLDLEPDNPDLLNDVGTVYFALARYRESIDCYRKALRIAPEHRDAVENLKAACRAAGLSWRDVLGKSDETREAACGASVQPAPAGAGDYAARMRDLLDTSRPDEALKLARRWGEAEPDNAEAWDWAAAAAYGAGKSAEAVGYIQQRQALAVGASKRPVLS